MQHTHAHPYPHKVKPAIRRRWLPWVIIGGMSAGLFVFASIIGILLIIYASQNRIAQGVTVGGVALGGKTIEAATSLLEQKFSQQEIVFTDGDRRWSMPINDIGVAFDAAETAVAVQKAGSNTSVQPRYRIDLNQAQSSLFSLSEQVNIPASVGEVGRAIDIPVILDRLRVDISGEVADGVLELNMFEVEPLPRELSGITSGATTTHTVQAGEELALIARQYNVSLDDIIRLNEISNPDLLYIGQLLIIPAAGVYEPTQVDAPPAPSLVGKSILVSLSHQRIYAYENGLLAHSHLASTGLLDTPTVLGDYSVYVKYTADDMSGPGYFLPQVPYTMYFYQGYAIHGTYWHNSFGRPMSHGCVNLPTHEAQWFFNWAEVGTPVRVIA